eukprot:3034678-Amphidinium_carterae.1
MVHCKAPSTMRIACAYCCTFVKELYFAIWYDSTTTAYKLFGPRCQHKSKGPKRHDCMQLQPNRNQQTSKALVVVSSRNETP